MQVLYAVKLFFFLITKLTSVMLVSFVKKKKENTSTNNAMLVNF